MAAKPPRKKVAWPRILLAVDFSPASRVAFEAASGLARDLGAGIVLAHVTPRVLQKDPESGRGPYLTPPELAVKEAVTLSETWSEELRRDDLFVKSLNPIGPKGPTIVDLARKHGCAMIVVGTTGRTGIKSALIGSVARELMQLSPVPVLVVPSRRPKVPKKVQPAQPATKSILLASDFSDESELAYQAASSLARDLKALLRVVHVIPLPSVAPFPLGAEYGVAVMEQEEEESSEELAQLASRGRKAGVGIVPSIQVGHPATAILAEARATGSSLIVLGTHGRGGARRFFLGSVAQGVVQLSDRPVLVVPGPPTKRQRGDWRM